MYMPKPSPLDGHAEQVAVEVVGRGDDERGGGVDRPRRRDDEDLTAAQAVRQSAGDGRAVTRTTDWASVPR